VGEQKTVPETSENTNNNSNAPVESNVIIPEFQMAEDNTAVTIKEVITAEPTQEESTTIQTSIVPESTQQ
jgi:hypothetical protein